MSRRKYAPAENGTKQCSQCRDYLPVSRFPKNDRMIDGYFHRCSTCIVANNKSRALNPSGNEYPFPTKNCPRCEMDVPVEAWSRDSGARYGLGTYCKECARQRLAERRITDPLLNTKYARARRKSKKRPVAAGPRKPLTQEQKQRKLETLRRRKMALYGCEASFDDVLASQGGVCLICSTAVETQADPSSRLDKAVIDHCHDSLRFRGILCWGCNAGLGFFRDNVAALRKAADYVENFNVVS